MRIRGGKVIRYMANQQKVGVITVTYNSAKVIDEFMISLLAQTHREFTVFVVDNASQDDTLRRVKGCKDERVNVIANGENLGFAEGTNQGIRASLAAGCDSVLLINNDTSFGPRLLDRLVGSLEKFQCDMAAPKMKYFDRKDRIWAAGGTFQRFTGCRNILFGHRELDRGQHDVAKRVTYSPGCCLLIRLSVFERVGLMDDRFFVYWEETDFLLRAAKAGVVMFYNPDAVIYHKVSSLTGGLRSSFTIFYSTRNRVYYIRKHFGRLEALWLLIGFQLYLSIRYGFTGSWTELRNAERAFLKGLQL
jgi:GT2 family glycosyltransferase